MNKRPISAVEPGDVVFVDLRSYGAAWYSELQLPDMFHKSYRVRYTYARWQNARMTKIVATCPLLHEEDFVLDNFFVESYGKDKNFDRNSMVLVDKNFIQRYPKIKNK